VLNNVTYKETGVVLEVTPRVNAGGVVTMDVNQSVSSVVPTTTSTIDSPTIQQRRLTSTISVKSGETVLLGGMIQQQNNRSSSGIPLLNELPGVGALFGTRQGSAGRTELIMLMTPHVIGSEDAARVATARVKREFQEVLDGNAMTQPRRPTR
jgi:general secretion pathway protein D